MAGGPIRLTAFYPRRSGCGQLCTACGKKRRICCAPAPRRVVPLRPAGRGDKLRGVRPQVLLVFLTRFEDSTNMLKGIAHYERTHQLWTAFHDDQGRPETAPPWPASRPWDGVISRHTTPGMVQMCAKLKIPLVDLNDTPPFPGVP